MRRQKLIMKNIIKMSLVVLGIVSATIVSSSNLSAKYDKDMPTGYCDPSSDSVCGVTAGGFTARGMFIVN